MLDKGLKTSIKPPPVSAALSKMRPLERIHFCLITICFPARRKFCNQMSKNCTIQTKCDNLNCANPEVLLMCFIYMDPQLRVYLQCTSRILTISLTICGLVVKYRILPADYWKLYSYTAESRTFFSQLQFLMF